MGSKALSLQAMTLEIWQSCPWKTLTEQEKKKNQGEKKKKAWTEAFDNGIHAPQRLCHQDHFLVASDIHYFVH